MKENIDCHTDKAFVNEEKQNKKEFNIMRDDDTCIYW